MNTKKAKKLRRELKDKLGRSPAKPQYNIRGEVVERRYVDYTGNTNIKKNGKKLIWQ